MPYPETHDRQLAVRAEVSKGLRESFFAALTHAPTITVGKRSTETPQQSELSRRGIALYKANRGGLATYHGPGQLMVYMFIDIDRLGIKIRQVVAAIEKGLIDWLFGKGIVATCVKGSPGVFVRNENGTNEKIAAIGLNFSRGVSMHGFSLYLQDDSAPFSLIEPCGVKGGMVTSVQAQLSEAVSPKECFESVANQIRSSIFSNAKRLDEVDSCDR